MHNSVIFFMVFLGLLPCQAVAQIESKPKEMLVVLLESDANGSSDARVNFFREQAIHERLKLNQQIAFDLDADAMILISSWKIIGNCSDAQDHCTLKVAFLSNGITSGYGIPSWMNAAGREIHVFNKPREIFINYKFVKNGGRWRFSKLNKPGVFSCNVKEYISNEIDKRMANGQIVNSPDPKVRNNFEIVKSWSLRQINELNSITCP